MGSDTIWMSTRWLPLSLFTNLLVLLETAWAYIRGHKYGLQWVEDIWTAYASKFNRSRSNGVSICFDPLGAPSSRVGSVTIVTLRRYGAFSVSALIGLVTLTFDLSISKWGHGSPCHGLPSCRFSAYMPFRSRLIGSGTGQTDGQTDDGHQRLVPPPYGDGG